MVGRILFILAVSVSVCHADVILVDVGGGTWKEISFVPGQVTTIPVATGTTSLRMVRLDFDGDPGPNPVPDPPVPTGLRGKIAAAAKAADDPTSTLLLSFAYTKADELFTAGRDPLPAIMSLLVSGQTAIFDTPEKRAKWTDLIDLTRPVLNANPISDSTKADVKMISQGLKDALGSNALLNY